MAFAADTVGKKLRGLSASQNSIQTLSLWLIHHRKHADVAVALWLDVFSEVKPDRKLALLYLANDVPQGVAAGDWGTALAVWRMR